MSIAECPLPKLCTSPGTAPGLTYGIAGPIFYNGTADGSPNGTYSVQNGTAAIDQCCALNNGTISTPLSGTTDQPASCFIQCAVSSKALESSLVDCLDKNETAHGCFAYDYDFNQPTPTSTASPVPTSAAKGLIKLNAWNSLLVGFGVLSAVIL